MTEAWLRPPPIPWRPVQYLGSKLRTLDQILETFRVLQPSGGAVWEPFAGSSVVSQLLAANGYTVHAGDALAASTFFTSAVLGVGRNDDSSTDLEALAARITALAIDNQRPDLVVWTHWVARETAALRAGDGPELLDVGDQVPQRWRSDHADEQLASLFHLVDDAALAGTPVSHGLASSTYAGTYFGLRQAIALDALRAAIDQVLPQEDPQNQWPRACMITALLHAASAAVFSPGKHFAQPHRIREGKDLGFHARRVLADRSVDVAAKFHEAVVRVQSIARPEAENHRAATQRVEEVSADELMSWGVTAVYADPPYTAQQYSRFYHVLETLVSSVPAKLQKRSGSVTRGLYPEGRYLSPFCSRTKAAPAIGELARKSAKAGADLVFSYSDSASSSTGNARSVSLSTLIDQVGEAYGAKAVSVQRLTLRYRQFNNSAAEVVGRDDPEYLVVAKSGRH